MLFVHLTPGDGIEPYIGAWAHLLAVSDDMVDTIHEHPFIADGGPDMQFNIFFPREAMYRVWIQFQRKGVVNTLWPLRFPVDGIAVTNCCTRDTLSEYADSLHCALATRTRLANSNLPAGALASA